MPYSFVQHKGDTNTYDYCGSDTRSARVLPETHANKITYDRVMCFCCWVRPGLMLQRSRQTLQTMC